LPDVISKDEWPPSSPDLNPLDFSIWGYMLAQLKKYKYRILDEVMDVILKIWTAIPNQVVRASCEAFDERLRLFIEFKGQNIEKQNKNNKAKSEF
jgi:hypothetical protein